MFPVFHRCILIIVNCFQTICKLHLKFAYQSKQAFVTVTVGTVGWIRYSLWPKLGLFVTFFMSFLFVCETLNDRAMLEYARCDCSTLTRESRTFPNSSRPISPNGIVPEMFLYPKYSVFSETEKVLERQIPDRRAVRPKSRSHRCLKSYAHSQGFFFFFFFNFLLVYFNTHYKFKEKEEAHTQKKKKKKKKKKRKK